MLFFPKNSHCDLDLHPRMLILKLLQDTVIVNSCVKLNENQSINVGASDENVFLKIATVTLTLALES